MAIIFPNKIVKEFLTFPNSNKAISNVASAFCISKILFILNINIFLCILFLHGYKFKRAFVNGLKKKSKRKVEI